jgi:hypothetical protein
MLAKVENRACGGINVPAGNKSSQNNSKKMATLRLVAHSPVMDDQKKAATRGRSTKPKFRANLNREKKAKKNFLKK